jgi:hypothetical protein
MAAAAAMTIGDAFSEVGEEVETIMLWRACCMIKRDKDAVEGPAPSTYLAMQVAAPVERGAVRPIVTGAAGMVVLPGPAWCHDPTGQEPPTGYAIDEVGAALGGAGGGSDEQQGSEVSAEVSGGRVDNSRGEQR